MKKAKVIHLWKYDRVKPKVERKPGVITAQELEQKLIKFFRLETKTWKELLITLIKRMLGIGAIIQIADQKYFLCSPSEVKHYLKDVSKREYRSDETFDCDDFSFLAKGVMTDHNYLDRMNYCFGVLWVYMKNEGVGHALNFFVDLDGKVKIYEPQTNEVFNAFPITWELIMAVV